MVIKVTSANSIGLTVHKILVEVDITNSLPQIVIVGLGDTAVSEAKERLKLAIKNSGYSFPPPRWPWAPRYNLHLSGRWVASSRLYCFQLPAANGSREACKPQADLASHITKCGLKKGTFTDRKSVV